MASNQITTFKNTGLEPITPFPNFSAEGLEDVRRLYAALPPTRDSLAVLFALDAAQTAPTEAWAGFFIETASAQLIWDERPTGTVREDDARWMLGWFDEAPSLTLLALLVRVLEEAHRLPSWFAAAVRQRATLFRATDPASPPKANGKKVSYLRLVA